MRMENLDLKGLLSTNPYNIPRYLLELVGSELRDTGIKYSPKPPQDKIQAPVVVPRVIRRIPSAAKGIGRSFSGYHKSTTEGELYEQYQQNYTLIVDFEIYYPATMSIEEGAWQLEQALIAQRGPLQTKYPGSDIIWKEVIVDRLDVPARGEIEKIVIRFQIELPTYTIIPRKTINNIDFDIVHNRLYYKDVRFVRSDASETYSISLDDKIVIGIEAIKVFRNEEYVTLEENLDYTLLQDIEDSPTAPVSIKWQEKTGLYPDVGEEFWVTFVTASLLTSTI